MENDRWRIHRRGLDPREVGEDGDDDDDDDDDGGGGGGGTLIGNLVYGDAGHRM